MNLEYVFKQLSAGEFSQLKIGESRGICEENRADVIDHIQLGLTSIYKRFNLLTKMVDIALVDGTRNYLLKDPRLFKITDVKDNYGAPVRLNVISDPCSVYTRSFKDLFVPELLTTTDYKDPVVTSLSISYMSDHDLIDEDSGVFVPDTVNLHLPDSHLFALLLFVASRVHNPIGMTNEFHAGNSYAAKYEQECARLEGQNLEVDDTQEYNHFTQQGFR